MSYLCGWQIWIFRQRQHGFSMEKEWLAFCTGVVPAISSMVRKLTTAGENVLVQTPVYNIFFHSIVNNGRNIVESPLQYDGNTYHMDFEDLEQKNSASNMGKSGLKHKLLFPVVIISLSNVITYPKPFLTNCAAL